MKQIPLPWPMAPIMLPILDWLPNYNAQLFQSDLIAGLTIFIFLIPQGMAYALLAGMPPVYGLYTSIVPLYVYAIFGTSQQLSLGPMAITSLLLGVGMESYSFEAESAEYVQAALGLSFLVGIVIFLLGIFQLGALANLISHSVLVGFLTASAFVIVLNQLPSILGLHVPRFKYTVQTIAYILTHLSECNEWAVLIGFFSAAVLYGIRWWKQLKANKPTPEKMKDRWFATLQYLTKASSLLLIVLASVVAYGIVSGGKSIDIIGNVPSGLQAPAIYTIGFSQMISALPTAFVIGIVAFAGNWAVAKKYAAQYQYRVDATQELIAEGLCVIFGSFFNGFICSGGLSRSAVNAESGARTQISGCIVATCMLIAVQSLTFLFYYIPKSVLGAIIMISTISMMDFETMWKIRRTHPRDCAVMVVTFLCTFFLGVSEGLFAGVLLSICILLHSAAFPVIRTIGRLPASQGAFFKDVARFEDAAQIPGLAIVRMDATLFFGNCEAFKEHVLKAATGALHSLKDPIEFVVLDVKPWATLDLAGTRVVVELREQLTSKLQVGLVVAGANSGVRDTLRHAEFVNNQQVWFDCPTLLTAVDGRAAHMYTLASHCEEVVGTPVKSSTSSSSGGGGGGGDMPSRNGSAIVDPVSAKVLDTVERGVYSSELDEHAHRGAGDEDGDYDDDHDDDGGIQLASALSFASFLPVKTSIESSGQI
jgi:sulfate permease, SulP family